MNVLNLLFNSYKYLNYKLKQLKSELIYYTRVVSFHTYLRYKNQLPKSEHSFLKKLINEV